MNFKLNEPVSLDKKYLLAGAGALLACGAGGLATSIVMKGEEDETDKEKLDRRIRTTLIGFTIGFFLAVIISILPFIMKKSMNMNVKEMPKSKVGEIRAPVRPLGGSN